MLSQQAIMEYQQLYKQAYGKEISYEDAADQGARLVALVKAVLYPKSPHREESTQKGGGEKCQ